MTNSVYAGIKDVYEFKWLDPKKKVFVLQNKIHKNIKSGNVSLGYGSGQLSDFQDTSAIHLMADYYLSEEWGLEFFLTSYSNSNNDSYRAVQNQVGGVIPHVIKFNMLYGLNLMFSPFYGKINTFNTIYYIDWSFGLGFAMIDADDNTTSFDANAPTDTYESESRFGFSAKTQVRWHLTDLINIQFDYITYFANLPKPRSSGSEGLKRSTDVIFSLGLKY